MTGIEARLGRAGTTTAARSAWADEALGEGQVGLWVSDARKGIPGAADMSAAEWRRMTRLATVVARRRFATAHALMSHAVRCQGPGLHVVQRCRRCGGDHGQPRVVGTAGATPWHVSLAHSSSLCAVALARAPIGVDVERMDDVARAGIDVILTGRERAALDRCPRDRRAELAGRLWCSKEALGKAMGVGLEGAETHDLLDVALGLDTPAQPGTRWGAWSFVMMDLGAGHRAVMAVAGRPIGGPIRNGVRSFDLR